MDLSTDRLAKLKAKCMSEEIRQNVKQVVETYLLRNEYDFEPPTVRIQQKKKGIWLGYYSPDKKVIHIRNLGTDAKTMAVILHEYAHWLHQCIYGNRFRGGNKHPAEFFIICYDLYTIAEQLGFKVDTSESKFHPKVWRPIHLAKTLDGFTDREIKSLILGDSRPKGIKKSRARANIKSRLGRR